MERFPILWKMSPAKSESLGSPGLSHFSFSELVTWVSQAFNQKVANWHTTQSQPRLMPLNLGHHPFDLHKLFWLSSISSIRCHRHLTCLSLRFLETQYMWRHILKQYMWSTHNLYCKIYYAIKASPFKAQREFIFQGDLFHCTQLIGVSEVWTPKRITSFQTEEDYTARMYTSYTKKKLNIFVKYDLKITYNNFITYIISWSKKLCLI